MTEAEDTLNNNSGTVVAGTLGVLYLVTGGEDGPNMGSDEEEVILMGLSLVRLDEGAEVLFSQTLRVTGGPGIETDDINTKLRQGLGISEEEPLPDGDSLGTVIEQLHTRLVQCLGSTEDFVLVTDGQLPLRQVLHPQASAKEISLPVYYDQFYDLKRLAEGGMSQEVVEYLNINQEKSGPTSLDEMTKIVQYLIREGNSFNSKLVDTVMTKLEPGLWSKDELVDGETVVRTRGLPWQSSDADIAKFFRGLNIAKGGVALCLSPQGRRNGEALVRFETAEHRALALRRHKHHIGTRYIEVYKATGEDFIAVAGGSNGEAQAFLTKGGQVIVRMRGLPYDCTAKQVLDFFSTPPSTCTVLDGEDGVLFVRRPDGRATGDAFVLFGLEEDAGKALSKHRESIGSRYIELFRSTTAEVQQVLNRCLENIVKVPLSPESGASPQQQQQLLIPSGPGSSPGLSPTSHHHPPSLPQHMITAGTRKDCVRLRGLPYEAQVEHILEFLAEHAKNIVYQGVHMVYNGQGQPTGEAFIQMDSESSAFLTASTKHHRYMSYFKKQRYIEVFQCSGEDMNLVLTGGLIPKPPAALLSPGGSLLTTPAAYPYYTTAQAAQPRNGYYPYYWQSHPYFGAAGAAGAIQLPGDYYHSNNTPKLLHHLPDPHQRYYPAAAGEFIDVLLAQQQQLRQRKTNMEPVGLFMV